MKLIGKIHTFSIENDRLAFMIPHYHRSSTGLLSETKLYAYPKISTLKNGFGDDVLVKEIIFSPFRPMNWKSIWKLELVTKDRPGLIKDITKILKDKRINIHIQESLITNNESDFTINLIVDCNLFCKNFKNELTNELDSLKSEMISDLDNSLKTINVNVEKLEPFKFLRNNSEDEVTKRNNNLIGKDLLEHFYNDDYSPIGIKEKTVTLDRIILDALDINVDSKSPAKIIQGTLFSDSEEKFIVLRLFDATQLLVFLDIKHSNKIGAINLFADAINNKCDKYNIISCYNRIEDEKRVARWNVLLDVSAKPELLPSLIKEIKEQKNIHVHEVYIIDYSKSIIERGIKGLENYESETQKRINRKIREEKEQLEIKKEAYADEIIRLKKGQKRLYFIIALFFLMFVVVSIVFLISDPSKYKNLLIVGGAFIFLFSGLAFFLDFFNNILGIFDRVKPNK